MLMGSRAGHLVSVSVTHTLNVLHFSIMSPLRRTLQGQSLSCTHIWSTIAVT